MPAIGVLNVADIPLSKAPPPKHFPSEAVVCKACPTSGPSEQAKLGEFQGAFAGNLPKKGTALFVNHFCAQSP